MILTTRNIHEVEVTTRRALAAIRLVDHASLTPLTIPARLEVTGAALVDLAPAGPPTVVSPVPLRPGEVRVHPTLRGWFAVSQAPQFETYTDTFVDPPNPLAPPAERRLRLQFAVTEVGPFHLPRRFELLLPRTLDPAAADSVLAPHDVALLRAPATPIAEGWSVLRVRVRNAAGATLPGVLVRVFRRPRPAGAEPIGVGITEWRDPHLRGEAVVPVPGLLRFAPGTGHSVLDTTHAIEIEATRDTNFPDPALRTAEADQVPDVDALIAGTGPTAVRRTSGAGPGALPTTPAGPHAIAAAQSLTVELTLP